MAKTLRYIGNDSVLDVIKSNGEIVFFPYEKGAFAFDWVSLTKCEVIELRDYLNELLEEAGE